jgi:type II secretory pathway pseudopilin PulG
MRLRSCSGTSSLLRGIAPRAFGLIELLALVAILAVLLALAVSVSRNVRAVGSLQSTQEKIVKLIAACSHFAGMTGEKLPVQSLPERSQLAEGDWRSWAILSTRQLVLQMEAAGHPLEPSMLRDAWGSPVALVPSASAKLGAAPGNAPFFMSAGPDRKYLTLSDNIYSYELVREPHAETQALIWQNNASQPPKPAGQHE